MNTLRFHLTLVIVCLIGFSSCNEIPDTKQTKSDIIQQEFAEMLDRLDNATSLFVTGNPDDFMSLWEQSSVSTLSGGLGGKIERGWDSIGERLQRVSSMYKDGHFTAERVAYGSDSTFGYIAQHETITHRLPDGTEGTRNYRTTMVFRYGDDGWKLIHRQADLHVVADGL